MSTMLTRLTWGCDSRIGFHNCDGHNVCLLVFQQLNCFFLNKQYNHAYSFAVHCKYSVSLPQYRDTHLITRFLSHTLTAAQPPSTNFPVHVKVITVPTSNNISLCSTPMSPCPTWLRLCLWLVHKSFHSCCRREKSSPCACKNVLCISNGFSSISIMAAHTEPQVFPAGCIHKCTN